MFFKFFVQVKNLFSQAFFSYFKESVTQMRRPAAPPPPPPGVHSSAYNHQQPSTPHRDRGPLPPPPAGCSSSNTTSSSMSPINMSSHDLTSLRSLNTSCAPSIPPPPPPRVSSCMDSIEQRFHFVPISELPPPPRFIGFKKIYEIGQHRKSTGTAHWNLFWEFNRIFLFHRDADLFRKLSIKLWKEQFLCKNPPFYF